MNATPKSQTELIIFTEYDNVILRQRHLMIGIQMSFVGYAEEFFRPVVKVKINGVGKIVKPPKPRLLSRICSRVETSFSEWTQHSYEAWVKNGRPDNF